LRTGDRAAGETSGRQIRRDRLMGRYTLYGDHRSGNCYKAALILTLTGRPFDWVETDVMQRATRTAEFLAMNPNGKVPVLRLPDGRYLAESNAVLLHLAEGTQYLSRDAYRRALAYQWLFFEQYSHEPYIAVARFIVAFAGREQEERERLATLRVKGQAALAVMEQALALTPFLTGDEFSVADIALYAYTHVAAEGGFDLEAYPQVLAWLARVTEVPGFPDMSQACR
jgi:glutathione S-transferase